MKKRRRKRHQAHAKPNLHITIGNIFDSKLAQRSAQLDAAADREWFRRHPDVQRFVRLATIRELVAHGCPPGTKVQVQRGPLGSQFRVFLTPERNSFLDHAIGGSN